MSEVEGAKNGKITALLDFQRRVDEFRGIADVQVTTAVPLDAGSGAILPARISSAAARARLAADSIHWRVSASEPAPNALGGSLQPATRRARSNAPGAARPAERSRHEEEC